MFLIWSVLTIPKHNIHLFPFFISLERDGHSCWNFFFDLLRASDLVLSKKLAVFLVICCSDFFFQERSAFFADPEGRSVDFVDLGHDPICWMLWYHVGFFQTTAGVRSDRYRFIFWTFWFFLISSADSVYFCAFVLFWLEIRLITIFPVCYW